MAYTSTNNSDLGGNCQECGIFVLSEVQSGAR